jgi:hypothetical protein
VVIFSTNRKQPKGEKMKDRKLRVNALVLIPILLLSACAPQADATPTVDIVGTMAAEMAAVMLTQTASAHSPTPPPTDTPIPPPSETPTPSATSVPVVIGFSPCYEGPGPNYRLTSNISDTKKVEILGIGSVPGWYVIENPYFFSPCWIAAEHLQLDPNFDPSGYPVISP